MPIILSENRTTGVTEFWDYDEQTGQAYIHAKKDVDRFLSQVAEVRNTKSAEKGILDNGREFSCYAMLDEIALRQIEAKGIKIGSSDPVEQMRLIREINENFSRCKVTDKHHG